MDEGTSGSKSLVVFELDIVGKKRLYGWRYGEGEHDFIIGPLLLAKLV